MSIQAATDFFNKLYTDTNLQKNLESKLGDLSHPVGDEERSFGETLALAGKQSGFDFDADEAKDAYKIFLGRFSGNLEGADAELSDADLAGIAGGVAGNSAARGNRCVITC